MRAKWILIGVAVIAIGAGLWWLNGARTYDELEFGGVSAMPTDGRWVELDFDREIALVPWRAGATTDYAVSVHNAGGRTIEITGVGSRAEDYAGRRDYQMTPVRVRMMPGDGLSRDALVEFEPVKLAPGERKTFVLYERLPSCRHFSPGSALDVGRFDVRFKSLVFDREASIELPAPIRYAECEEA